MKYLYYCNSAYQLLNIMNLHYHRNNGFENIVDYSADLVLRNGFSNVDNIVRILKDNKVFSNIFIVDRKENTTSKLHLINSIKNIIFPLNYLKDNYPIDINLIKNQYDYIVTTKFTPFIAAMWQVNKKAKLHLHEDGAGSYIAYFDLEMRSKSYKMFYKLFNNGKDFYNYEKIYLNNKDIYTRDDKNLVVEIPKFNKDYLKQIKKMFKEYIYDYGDIDIYWLSQKLDDSKGKESFDAEEEVLYLKKYKDKVLYCPHPRYFLCEHDFKISDIKQIWELQVLDQDNFDDKLIISVHSTACLTPKILFDKQPYVIFLYKLVIKHDWYFFKEMEKVIELFKNSYSDPSKIMIPETLAEYKECIDSYIKNH